MRYVDLCLKMPQDAETPLLWLLQILNLSLISITVLKERVLDAGLHKRDTFSTLIVSLARTGDQT
jgi:hypothetical protein